MTYPTEQLLDAHGDGVQAVIDTAQAAAKPTEVGDTDLLSVVLPRGAEHRVIDVEAYREPYRAHPRRKTGTIKVFEADSFIAYYRKHATDQVSELYADAVNCTLVAVLDAHGADDAGWGQHRLQLALRKTPEWAHWAGSDRKTLRQVEFAEHIEEGLPYIVDPPGAQMLEIAETFQAKTKVQFTSGNRLSSGERQLVYTEDTDASAGRKGELTIPGKFELGLAPFEGIDPFKVSARLRYRINQGQLTLTYLLEEPHKVLREAFGDVLIRIEEQLGVEALHGAPA